MSDVNDNQELDMVDISVEDFEKFSAEGNAENMFDAAEFENMTFDESLSEDMTMGATGDMSEDFALDSLSDNEIASMFEGGDETKQEPYFESPSEDLTNIDSSFADAFQTEENIDSSFADAFQADENIDSSFADAFQAEENVDSSFADAFQADESFTETLATEEYVEPMATEEYVEPMATEEYVEPMATEEYVEPMATEEYSFNDNQNFGDVGAFDIIPSQDLKYIQWYSGNSDLSVYEFGKSSASGDFIGNRECNTIHVNVGYDTYGWIVQFSDGVVMSLRDVREYQIRNGKLPNSSGRIVYGQNVLSFENVERIVIYEAVKYFSYGM